MSLSASTLALAQAVGADIKQLHRDVVFRAGLPSRTVTGSATAAPADAGGWIVSTSDTPITITIAAEAAQAWPADEGRPMFHILQLGAGTVTVAGDGFSVTLHDDDTAALDGRGSAATAVRIGPDAWQLVGRLVPA